MARAGDESADRGPDAPRDDPATAVFSWRAAKGREDQFGDWAHGVHATTSRFPGHLGATVLHEDGSRDFHLIHQFAHQSDLQRWLDSSERAQWVAGAEPLADERTAVQQRTGLETWFHVPSHPTRPPPRWKMWLVSLLAIYPLVLAFQAFLVLRTASWPLPVRAAMFPLVLLTLMTYVVMPVVTRVLRRWL